MTIAIKRENNSKRIAWIWAIFIVATLNTILNILFLFGWVDVFWGSVGDVTVNNGNGYTIIYWFTHISYISSCLVIVWSGYELVCNYILKREVPSIFRYYTILWITITMVCFMPQWPFFFTKTWKHWFGGQMEPGWPGTETNLYIYEVLDMFQVTVMHFVVAIMCIVFYAKHDGKTEKITKTQISNFAIMSIVFLIMYWMYCGIATYNGAKEPYPILNWNPDDLDKWPIYLQVLSCLGFGILYYAINIPVLKFLNKRTRQLG